MLAVAAASYVVSWLCVMLMAQFDSFRTQSKLGSAKDRMVAGAHSRPAPCKCCMEVDCRALLRLLYWIVSDLAVCKQTRRRCHASDSVI